ncbi:hypothetical protein HDU87_007788 [Geranomyces variabilis]|uniref:Uncharacterized protein n=1 Tax=Geranomyces variabilis TaxID=109894 RepID=A0AAD5TDH0_9FUNG|nr:hypothetical protein HDU87_007788 [Geranomyces variabilis]
MATPKLPFGLVEEVSQSSRSSESSDVAVDAEAMELLLQTIQASKLDVKINTAAHLISRSIVVLTETRPAAYDDFFTDEDWMALRRRFDDRRLKTDDALWATLRTEAKDLLNAKSNGAGYYAKVEEPATLERVRIAGVLNNLFLLLDTAKPDCKQHEATWSSKLLHPYFLMTPQGMKWSFDNRTRYGAKRPDYFVYDSIGRALASFEVKTHFVSSVEQRADVFRTVSNCVDHIIADAHEYSSVGTQAKICATFSGREGTIFEVCLHRGIFLAVQIGTWTVPVSLNWGRETEIAMAIATGQALMHRLLEFKQRTDGSRPRADPKKRPSCLLPQTPA